MPTLRRIRVETLGKGKVTSLIRVKLFEMAYATIRKVRAAIATNALIYRVCIYHLFDGILFVDLLFGNLIDE